MPPPWRAWPAGQWPDTVRLPGKYQPVPRGTTNRADDKPRPGILIPVHYGHVPPMGTLRDNPYRIEDNRLYGPGGYDMEASIYPALSQYRRASSTPLPMGVLMMPDTETDSHAPRGWVKPYTGNAKYALVYTPAHPTAAQAAPSVSATAC